MYVPTEYSWRNVQVRALLYEPAISKRWHARLKTQISTNLSLAWKKRQNELQNAKKRSGFQIIPLAIAV